MNSQERLAFIRETLTLTFSPTHLEIVDESQQHVGHAGNQQGAGHYSLIIASPAFTDKKLIECHRLIYAALDSVMHTEIHALKIKIKTI